MNEATFVGIAEQGLYLALLLSLPPVVVSLLIGLVVGALQTATQLRDGTITFVPRLAAVLAVLVFFGGWMGRQLVSYAQEVWSLLGAVRF